MIVARISCSDRPDRLVELEPGQRSFGSDFGCDVVLTEDFVQPTHFVLDVTPDGVFVEMAEGADGAFSPKGRKTSPLAHGQRLRWGPRGRLHLGDLTIMIAGDECRKEKSRAARIADAAFTQSGRILKVSCVVFASVAVVSVTADLLMRSITPPQDAAAASVTPMIGAVGFSGNLVVAPPAPAPEPATRSASEVANDLASLGYTPTSLSGGGATWFATFHLSDQSKRAGLDRALAGLEYRVKPTVYFDTALRVAAELVFRSFSGGAEIAALEAGEMKLALTEGDPDKRRAVRETLLADVVGLRDIVFVESEALARLSALKGEILAVWSGRRPYVALQDGREIRLGQTFKTGIELVAVESARVLIVNVDGNQQELRLP